MTPYERSERKQLFYSCTKNKYARQGPRLVMVLAGFVTPRAQIFVPNFVFDKSVL